MDTKHLNKILTKWLFNNAKQFQYLKLFSSSGSIFSSVEENQLYQLHFRRSWRGLNENTRKAPMKQAFGI